MNLGEDMNGSFPNADTVNGSHVGYSTVFPVSMSRGAAFDLDLEYAIGEAIGDEMQAASQTLLLAPCMNILRHPLWGRAQETYGEDSFHVGRLASAMVVGVQQHIAANAKHYMGYDIENGRTLTNNSMMADEQVLRETFGRHFRMTVQDAGVASVMASYNEVNGIEVDSERAHFDGRPAQGLRLSGVRVERLVGHAGVHWHSGHQHAEDRRHQSHQRRAWMSSFRGACTMVSSRTWSIQARCTGRICRRMPRTC